MTIIGAINRVDELKPNGYTQAQKIEWLSSLDGMIKRTVIDTHEGGDDIHFTPYNTETDLDTELLVAAPYDELYIHWLESKIDYANAEYAHYNNSTMRFNDVYADFANDYNRTHMPKGNHFKYF